MARRQHLFEAARRRAHLTVEQLWLDYLALGGEVSLGELELCLQGLMPLSRPQHAVLAHALYERLVDQRPIRPRGHGRPSTE